MRALIFRQGGSIVNQAVLVTGASTGIGHATALRLAAEGFDVFAGVRSAADGERLQSAGPNIRPLLLDVTHAAAIGEAAQRISQSGLLLRGVINNAGIAVAGPLEFLPLDQMRRQFEINVFGALAVTQAMLPMLRASCGRVVFVSSVSGQIAPPFIGPYASSKFALEGMADSMRMELAPFGIAVSIIQPGNVRTPIWGKGRAAAPEIRARMPAEATAHYGNIIDALAKLTQREERTGINPAIVAAVILRALREPAPRARYAVGSPPAWQRRMAAMLPERWRDRLIMRNFGKA
jgi:NAD(P)-dependent dehydrogenase (short-subunit alcohol dehydrogenase family)